MGNKKGQLTIFIVLAIIIIAVLVIVFMQDIKVLIAGGEPINNLKKCMEEPVEAIFEKIMLQGGSLEPENYFLYQGDKIEYACYTDEYYKKCVMQKPFLKQDIEEEIRAYIEPKVEKCFLDVRKNLEQKGYDISMDFKQVQVEIVPNSIILNAEANLVMDKEGSSSKYKNIKTDISSGAYDILMVASSISNWEARYGDSESMVYMGYYPNLKIEILRQGDGTTVYMISDRTTKEKFQFASRSVVFPPGY